MIKEEYKNISDEEFVPLTCVDDVFKGKYKINKLGQILTIESGKIREAAPSKHNLYPSIGLSNRKIDNKTKNYYIHLLVAKNFSRTTRRNYRGRSHRFKYK